MVRTSKASDAAEARTFILPRHRPWREAIAAAMAIDAGRRVDGRFAVVSYEMPWITASVAPQPGLQPFLSFFEDPDTWADDDPAMDAILLEVDRRGGFKLFDDDGGEVERFTLVNLSETEANLRL